MTAREALAEVERRLAEAGVETPRVDAEWLVAHILGTTRSGLAARLDDDVVGLEPLLARRERREPLAYVLGEWGFRRLTLKTDARALVPRPETETLVERGLALAEGIERPRILDVGVGSGAIALALKDERPDAQVTGVDISIDALALARENAERLGLEIELREGDGAEAAAEGWDVVVANPPYVASLDELQPELRWEPEIALIGSGGYDRLARASNSRFLVVEVGAGWAQSAAAALRRVGWRDIRITADLTGVERVVEAAHRNEAVFALRTGRAVILPTDTVYGLCALPQHEGVLYELKGRDRSKPVALVAADVGTLVDAVPGLDRSALDRYLPGPYTLVFEGVGVRVPKLPPAAAEVVRAVGVVAATSANLAGGPDPRRVEDIPEEIRIACGAVVDAGELPGVPSTVIDLTGAEPRVLRDGAGPSPSSILAMATQQATFQELKHAGLDDVDPEIAGFLGDELERQRGQIELIASENFTWPAVLEAVGSVATNKYAEGYPGRRYYGGCEVIDEIEQLAIDRAKELFGAEHANVQPHAGAQTNMAVYAAVMEPGDTLMALALNQGGHLTHGHKVNFSGRLYNVAHYEVSRTTMTVDYDDVLAKAKEARPKVIVCGGSAYPRTVEADRFRTIADEVGAILVCDMAHFAGLVAAGLHPNPVEHCDFVTSTTHKTLAGPRAGFVLCREEHAKALDSAVMPGMQGGPLEHTIAAKATCFRIAMTDAFREYQAQIRRNADALGETLLEGGLSLVTGGTDTHLLLVDLSASEWTGKAAEERLQEIDVTVNRNTIPFDERSPFVTSGIRLGSPAMTMRGFDEDDFREVGRIICEALTEAPELDGLCGRVATLCAKRPLYEGFRGYTTYVA